MPQRLNGILQASANVVSLNIGIVVSRDFLEGQALTHEFKDVDYRYPRSGYARLAEVHVRIDRDAFFHGCTNNRESVDRNVRSTTTVQ